jgi:hypothetical protein
MADREKLRQQLEQLHAELHQAGSLGPNERELLEKLAADVQSLLDRGEVEDEHYAGLTERLRNGIAELEASHPTATLRLRQLIDELAYLGI